MPNKDCYACKHRIQGVCKLGIWRPRQSIPCDKWEPKVKEAE